MTSLFIDTSYKSMFLGLVVDDKLIDSICMMAEANFSEVLLPSLDSMLKKNAVDLKKIDKLFVTIGPGSFTGIRIGLTVCKVLAWVLHKGVIPISSLEFMATTEVDVDYKIPIIDARHDMVFGAVYDRNDNLIVNDAYVSLDELKKKVNSSYVYITYDNLVPEKSMNPNYDVVKLIKKHLNDVEINGHALKPNYLKKTEAEESRL